jgi:peptidoglycan/LPS O-acetylase OafA/YrhL
MQTTHRNHGIDVLRGIAIVLVIIHHLALPFRLPLANSAVSDAFGSRFASMLSYSGYYGVYLFFVISGFLIASRASTEYRSLSQINILAFYRRRARRIMPLLFALLVVLSVLHWIGVKDYLIDRPGQSLIGAWFAAVGLHLNWYEAKLGYLPGSWDVLWSLSIEELFYLLFPLVCFTLRGWMLPVALVALAITMPFTLAQAAEHGEIWGEKAYLPGMSAIAIGVIAALIHARRPMSMQLALVLLWVGGLAFAACLQFRGLMWSTWKHNGMLFYSLLCTLLILACASYYGQTKSHKPMWLSRMFAHFGRLSYELYLTHMFVVLTTTVAFKAWLPEYKYWAIAVYPVTLVLCERLAWACERYIGRPGARLFRG